MAATADATFVDGEIRVRPGTGRTAEALAVRNGTVCRVADTYEVTFLEGIETRRVDLDGRTVVPGFVDGWTRLTAVGGRTGGYEGAEAPGSVDRARKILTVALEDARERGLTAVHDEVRSPVVARAYHELAREGALPTRVRLTYGLGNETTAGSTPIDAVETLGLTAGTGTGRLQIEAIGIDVAERKPDAVRAFLRRAHEAGFPVTVTATDGDALSTLLSGLEGIDAPRIRVRLGDAPTESQIRTLAAADASVVGHPGAPSGAIEGAQADSRTAASSGLQFGPLLAAGLPVAFGGGGAPEDPLRFVERAVTADQATGLDVSGAMRIATGVSARGRLAAESVGSLEVGDPADFAVLSASPWKSSFDQVSVDATVLGGSIAGETT